MGQESRDGWRARNPPRGRCPQTGHSDTRSRPCESTPYGRFRLPTRICGCRRGTRRYVTTTPNEPVQDPEVNPGLDPETDDPPVPATRPEDDPVSSPEIERGQ